MSDCFDHQLDAFESEWDCKYGDRPDYYDCGYIKGRESYYDTFKIKKIIHQTEKAYLLELLEEELPFIGDEFNVRAHTVLVWIPKSVVRHVDGGYDIEDDEYVDIHVNILKGCLKNCIPKQKEMRNFQPKNTPENKILTKEEREKISRQIIGLHNRTNREDVLIAVIKRYEALLQAHNL